VKLLVPLPCPCSIEQVRRAGGRLRSRDEPAWFAIPLDPETLSIEFYRVRCWAEYDDDPKIKPSEEDEGDLLMRDLSKVRALVNIETQMLFITFLGECPNLDYDYGFIVGEEVLARIEAASAPSE
jgi:hypothetical protein